MSDAIVVVGAGRQGRNVAEILALTPTATPVAGFLDDTKRLGDCVDGQPVRGGFERLADPSFVAGHRWIVAVGDCSVRYDVASRLDAMGAQFASAIHPTVLISKTARLGRGLYLAGYSNVRQDSWIGDWCIVESGVMVGANAQLGAACLIGGGSQLTGGASTGDRTLIASGVVLGLEIAVGADCVIGANAAVIRDVPDNCTAYGVPARIAATRS